MKTAAAFTQYIVRNALREDLGSGDITTQAIIAENRPARGLIRFKQNAIICGQDIAREVFFQLDRKSRYSKAIGDKEKVTGGSIVAEVRTNLGALLMGERVALNFIMHLSGIATLTSQFVERVEGLGVKILDTRKTTPGLRFLEKYAVRIGGGTNHRIGLYDMFLIKDNHIATAGTVGNAIEACLNKRHGKKVKIEVEVQSLNQLRQALEYKIDRIMLDNMSLAQMRAAVKLIRQQTRNVEIEASGNVSLKNVRRIAETGVDFISVGALTHSALAIDVSMEIVPYA